MMANTADDDGRALPNLVETPAASAPTNGGSWGVRDIGEGVGRRAWEEDEQRTCGAEGVRGNSVIGW